MMAFRKLPLAEIKVSKRFRKDLGDVADLAKSIEAVGLLHPIVVDSEFRLIAGGRRLKAVKSLKWRGVPVQVVSTLSDATLALVAERDENICRKELLPSEKVALGKELEKRFRPEAKKAQVEGGKAGGKIAGKGRKKDDRVPEKNGKSKHENETSTQVGSALGLSGRTYDKAKAVVDSGDEEAIEQMDRTGKVGPAFNQVKQKQKRKELQNKAKEAERKAKETQHRDGQPLWSLIHGDAVEVLRGLDEQNYARLAIADPPYNIGIDYGDGKSGDLLPDHQYIAFCSHWMAAIWDNLTDDGSFWLIVSDEFAAELCVEAKRVGYTLRSWIKWFEGFGVNCANNFNRTTRHIFWFVCDPKRFVFHSHEVMRPSDRQTKYNDKRANAVGKIENDLWDVPRLTGICKERIPGVPTQIPIAIVDRIVRCASDPGDLVIDPFNGSGSTGVAAIRNHRKYIGIDLNEQYIELASARLRCEQ